MLVGGLCDLLTREASHTDKALAYIHLITVSMDLCCHFISHVSLRTYSPVSVCLVAVGDFSDRTLTSFFFFLFISAQFIFHYV